MKTLEKQVIVNVTVANTYRKPVNLRDGYMPASLFMVFTK